MQNISLSGIITALVTPFSSDGKVDEIAMREIVRFQLDSGIHGFFPLGTNGMGPATEFEERKRVAEIVVNETARRIPVIIHVGAADPDASIALAIHAREIGASAVASVTPFYYNPDSLAIVDYYTRLSEATRLPTFVYNIPRLTGNNVSVELLSQLSKIPGIVGIKDSSRDFSQLLDYLNCAPSGFNVISGTDSFIYAGLCSGTKAGVSAIANVFPELLVQLYRKCEDGELSEARQIQLRIHALRAILEKPPITPLLEALRMRGLRSGKVKMPLRSMIPSEIQALGDSLRKAVPEVSWSL